ncbi:MAG TPA: alanine racemase [Candidatus Sulfotelmatobacter sp.]|nr:alanine racemase [Candidatus Sulfotelmatobacter sp.]
MGPTVAEIDLAAIAHNVTLAKRLAGSATEVMAVVKADGYGHGALAVARTALSSGATWLGVAAPEEGRLLRQAGILAPILVLGPILPDQAATVVTAELDQCVSDVGQAEALASAARAVGRRARVHLKVDTGMGRVGVQPGELCAAAARLAALPGLHVHALMTHFAEAEAQEAAALSGALHRFDAAWRTCRGAGLEVAVRHAANSAALLLHPEARFDLVRPGLMLYGYHPRGAADAAATGLRPALRLRSAITQLKDLPAGASVSYGGTFVAPRAVRIAVVPIGYADGWGRLLSNRGQALVRGRRIPMVGRVCMDMTLLDVTDCPEARVGDEVVLLGRQGAEAVGADDVAALQGTISYEVLARIGPRIPRRYDGAVGASALDNALEAHL